MTLQQLKYIVEISKTGSISKAAQNLFMTQPAISKAISNLEEELRIEILERGNRGILFTAEGAELLGYAKQMLEQAETIKSLFQQPNEPDALRLNIASQHYSFVVDAFIMLMKSHQSRSFELHLREGKTVDLIEDVYSGRSAIGVIAISTAMQRLSRHILDTKMLDFHEMASVGTCVFIGAHHPLAGQSGVTLEQLKSYPCLTYAQEHDSLNFVEEGVWLGRQYQMVCVKDRATTCNLLAHTDCYNIGTGILAEGLTEGIISLPIRDYSEKMSIGWLMRKNTPLTPEISEYLEYLQLSLDRHMIR